MTRQGRAPDKREKIENIFSYFSVKPHVVTPHLNSVEKVQMRDPNICFMQY